MTQRAKQRHQTYIKRGRVARRDRDKAGREKHKVIHAEQNTQRNKSELYSHRSRKIEIDGRGRSSTSGGKPTVEEAVRKGERKRRLNDRD